MKVLFISRRFYPDVTGGGQISAYHIARAVREQGHEVYVLTFTTEGYKEEELEGIKVLRYPIFYVNVPLLSHFLNLEGMYVQMAWRAYKVVGALKPDIVHLLNIESIYLTSWILRMKKIPSFATINGPCICPVGDCVDYEGESCIECSPSKAFACLMRKKGGTGLLGYVKRFLKAVYQMFHAWELGFFVRQVTELFPVSRAIEQLFIKNGFDAGRLKVIHNPVQLNDKVKTDLAERLGAAGRKVILYAGRVTEEKGVHKAVEAMKSVDGAVFLIAGKGSYGNLRTGYYKGLEDYVRENRLEGKVKFIGFVAPADMEKYYSLADLVVLPGTFYEPLSRMLLEAESYGVPAIAANVGGNLEVVEDGRTGILLKTQETAELAEAIKYILGNPKVYREMSEHCREKIRREFSPEKIGKGILQEYSRYVR